MKRIVEVTYIDGRKMYRAQTNRLFGLLPIPWITITAFEDLVDAKKYCGVYDEIIKRKVIWKSKN